MLQNSNAISVDDSYVIERSLRFNSASNQYLSRAVLADFQTTWTWSCWVKRGTLGTRQHLFGINNSNSIRFSDTTLNAFTFEVYNGVGANYYIETTQLFRDTSSWYHFVCVWDTTNATASERQRVYVNGSRVTSFASGNAVPLNAISVFNGTATHEIGRSVQGGFYFDGEIAENIFISGEALDASAFGEFNPTTNQWVAKKYSGIFDINSFYLDFKDGTSTTTLGYDKSENENNWTLTNFTRSAGVNDCWMLDVPSGNGNTGIQPSSNYAVLNNLQPLVSGFTSAYGNLRYVTSVANNGHIEANFHITSGIWYWEYTVSSGNMYDIHGVCRTNLLPASVAWNETGTVAYYAFNGAKYVNGVESSYGSSYTLNDVIGVLLNKNNNTIEFLKNNISQGIIALPTTDALVPYFSDGTGGSNTSGDVNFGQRAFAYTPPAGSKSLCTANLPIPSIKKPKEHFDINLSVATTAVREVTSFQFKPDLVIAKSRGHADRWGYIDSVRGVNRTLASEYTNAEEFYPDLLTSFNSNGFSLGADSIALGWNYNRGGGTPYVYYAWKGAGSSVSNTDGTITSQVSANTTAGFSIVTYTGTGANTTVGHGLGTAPEVVITKRRNSTGNWQMYHSKLNSGTNPQFYKILLNSNGAYALDYTAWNSLAPNSTTFSLGTNVDGNANTGTYVAYCFASIPGYSKFGTYTPNGSSDGPYEYLGFTPRFLMVKYPTAGTGSWVLYDSARNIGNSLSLDLLAQSAAAEATLVGIDFLSNGFKIRGTSAEINVNTGTQYIYMAFAETPFQYSNAR